MSVEERRTTIMREWAAWLRDLARRLDPAGDDQTPESSAQAADALPAGESTVQPPTEDLPSAGPPAHWLKDIEKHAPHLLERFRVGKRERPMPPEEPPPAGVSYDSTAGDAPVDAIPPEHTATPQTDDRSVGPPTSARRDPTGLSTEQSDTLGLPHREPKGTIESGYPTKRDEPRRTNVADRAASDAEDNTLPGDHTETPQIDVLSPAETVPAQSGLTGPPAGKASADAHPAGVALPNGPADSEQQTSQVAVENGVRSERFPELPDNQKDQIDSDLAHEGGQAGSTESETSTQPQPSDASSDLEARAQEEASHLQSVKSDMARDTHDASAASEMPSAMTERFPAPDSKSTSTASEEPEKEPSSSPQWHAFIAPPELRDTASAQRSRESGRVQAAEFPASPGTTARRDAAPDWRSRSAGSARSAAKPMAMPEESVADRWPELPEESPLDWYDALAAERIEVERRRKLELEQLGIPWNE